MGVVINLVLSKSEFDAWVRSILAKYDHDPRPIFLSEGPGNISRLNAGPFKRMTLRFAFPTPCGPGLQEMEIGPP